MGAFQFFVFMAFTTIWTALFLSIIASKKAGEYDYNPATIVFMVDLLKMAVTIVSCLFSQVSFQAVLNYKNVGIYYAFPALIYTISNNLTFYNLTLFDAATFRVLYNFRVVTSGLLFQLIFGRQLGSRKWVALLILFTGCVINQWKGLTVERLLPLFWIALHCFCSSLGGVASEFLLKKDPETSIHVQNIYLYLFSFFFNTAATIWSGVNPFDPKEFFQGYSWSAILVIILYALAGLTTSMLLKHLSAILKEFASAFVMIEIAVLADVLFNERPESGLATFLSIIFVSVSLYIYNVEPPREEVKKPDTEAPGDQA